MTQLLRETQKRSISRVNARLRVVLLASETSHRQSCAQVCQTHKRALSLATHNLTVPQTPTPHQAADIYYAVLTRLTERIVVQRYIYPALLSPPPTLQTSLRSGRRGRRLLPSSLCSTQLSTCCHLNLRNIISLDFSKAFDTVRHSSLLHKLAQLELPDNI